MLAPQSKFTAGLYSEHLTSIGFLLDLRLAYFRASDVPWTKVAELDARIEAHRDALELGGAAATNRAVELLEGDDEDALKGAVYHLAWNGPKADGHKEMIAAWVGASDKRLPAYLRALCFAAQCQRSVDLVAVLKSTQPLLVLAALELSRFLVDLKADALLPFCSHEPVGVRRAAVGVCALKGGKALLAALEHAVLDEFKPVDDAAAFRLLALGSVRTLGAARDACRVDEMVAPHWLMCIAYAGSNADLPVFARAMHKPALRLAAIRACSVFGHIELVPQLISALAAQDERERVEAANALQKITGAGLTEIAVTELTTEVTVRDVIGNTAVAPASTQSADLVEVTRASTAQGDWSAWWNANASHFSAAPRWRKGQPANLGVLIEQLADPSSDDNLRRMNQFELVVRSGMAIDCFCDGPVAGQLATIEQWRQWWKKSQSQHANNYWLFAGRG